VADFDAIVIGSGMSGGWAAKELCERGLKVLVLERGQDIDPAKDYSDMTLLWERPHLDLIPEDEVRDKYTVQYGAASYSMSDSSKFLWVDERDQPYETPKDRPFRWVRGYHVGGKSLMWSRQSYRWCPQDFENNKLDGHGVDWPIRYEDLAPWYDHVEEFAGISGSLEGIAQLPDGKFLRPFELTAGEQHLRDKVEKAFPTRNVIPGRCAHLREAREVHTSLGRSQCQVRNHCHHGCSFGAYFSSVSATLPAARRTGNMTLISNAVAQSLDYDPVSGRVSGVNVVDAITRAGGRYTAKMVFLCAGTLPSAMILLNSCCEKFPTGLANSSDQVGRNVMDHVTGAWAGGVLPGLLDRYYYGRRPDGIYIPRYANFTERGKPYLRGFGFQGGVGRRGWTADRPGVGKDFKEANRSPGPWIASISAFGECLPNPDNRIRLHETRKDAWGLPVAMISCAWGANEIAIVKAAAQDARDMLRAAGVIDIKMVEIPGPPGNGIHEMGTARMGLDASTSVLNGWNQAHDVKNLFVTDGACMASSACQNPSLTYMAITARAASHAASLLQEGQV
jgi:choline dehydrogenase-like flavoprotein